MTHSIQFGPTTLGILVSATPETCQRIVAAVIAYVETGAEPEDLPAWETVKADYDKASRISAARAAAGRKGGLAKLANLKQKCSKSVAKPKQNSSKTLAKLSHAQEETTSLNNIETGTLTPVEEKNNYVIPKEEPPSEPPEPQPFALTSEPVPVPAKSAAKKFKKPDVFTVAAYCQERHNGVDAQAFVDFYESKGWMVGKNPMRDWKAAVRTWEHGPNRGAGYLVTPPARGDPTKFYNPEPTDWSKLGQTYDSAKPTQTA